MAYKLIWSPASSEDLHDIIRFIARDSLTRAQTFGYRLISEIEKLVDFPELGRIVPEHQNVAVRELIVRRFRIVYRVHHASESVEIVRLWHAARGTPDF
jgi:toxin ParE1/3/4